MFMCNALVKVHQKLFKSILIVINNKLLVILYYNAFKLLKIINNIKVTIFMKYRLKIKKSIILQLVTKTLFYIKKIQNLIEF